MARSPKKSAKKVAARASKPKAAPGRKRVTRAEIAAAEQKPETITKIPPKGFIKKFVSETLPRIERDMESLRGDIGSAIANAAERQHVEKRALSIVRRLHKMPDKKFQETWEHLRVYFDEMDFQGRADRQGKLALEEASQTDLEEAIDEAGPEVATQLAPGRKPRMKVMPNEDEPEPQSTADAMGEALKADGAGSDEFKPLH